MKQSKYFLRSVSLFFAKKKGAGFLNKGVRYSVDTSMAEKLIVIAGGIIQNLVDEIYLVFWPTPELVLLCEQNLFNRMGKAFKLRKNVL
ncbi:hypothetical protein AT05_04340 [Schleiferia thermophila str. Yellowstone]|jgi:hypothetical protein|uniref:Uncharacterized protein n=1 Tax=Schleiferia thermophila TaxID=884107 RepID=A0A369ABZ2_9FLAO|nr:hypothetical protein AT05_04340 [Schleiferia thermophila str. Yellowstone]RCX04934.1 hypothetical protein DES35_101213 [Schleiferia thermophila]